MTAGEALDLEAMVAKFWTEALDLEADERRDATFFELGGYSLLALSLADRIARECGLDLPRTLVFDHPTLDELVAHVAHEVGAQQPQSDGPAGRRSPQASREAGTDNAAQPGQDAGQAADRTAGDFPVSPLQHAYLLGETAGFELGRPAVAFEEYRCEPFDIEHFMGAMARLIERHEMLRASFDAAGTQRVAAEISVPMEVLSWRGLPAAELDQRLAQSRDEMQAAPPALEGPAVFRGRIIQLDTEFRVQFCGRLLVFDGLSGYIFADDLQAFLDGEDLAPLEYTYREYRVELDRRRQDEEYQRCRRYWMDRIETLPAAPDLPIRGTGRPSALPLQRRSLTLDCEQWAAFQQTTRRHGLSSTVAVCTAFCEILRNWSKSRSFTVNMLYGERLDLHRDVPRIIGNFGTTLLLQYDGAGETFAERAAALQERLRQDLAHGRFGGAEVIHELNRYHGNLASAAMPVVFASLLGASEPSGKVFLERIGWHKTFGAIDTPQVSFDHQVMESSGELIINWDTADDMYPEGVLDDMLAAYRQLLGRLAEDEQSWGERTFTLTPTAQLAVRERANDTARETPQVSLHGMVLERAQRQPDRIAVLGPDGTVTYRELVTAAGAIADRLHAEGCWAGDFVGVIARGGWRQVAALLGVLCAGCAYVPLTPQWPSARRRAVLGRANARAVLVDPDVDLAQAETGDGRPILRIDEAIEQGTAERGLERVRVIPESPAYAIFTSGTTGEPKGVLVRHQSAANTTIDINERYAVGPDDCVMSVSQSTFDLSVYDVFGLLAAGGSVAIPRSQDVPDLAQLYEFARDAGVTIWNSVPAYASLLADYVENSERPALSDLRLVMVSGDWVPLDLARQLARAAPAARVVSLGGATEASIWSNHFEVPVDVPPGWASIPYGFPLRNQRYHVLDEDMRDRPDWVPGHLLISGRGLADGYLNDEPATAKAFCAHPDTGERLYRTGDWGRYWPDGTLEFLGREDTQVKVNGFRVELGEIEACLLRSPDVNDVAVVLVGRDGERGSRTAKDVRLVACVASRRTDQELADELIAAARHDLPTYMVPSRIYLLREMPLTANGKVDRRALADVAHARASTVPAHAPANTETERRLLALWRTLLGADVTVTDDFFELGGGSLAAARLMGLIEREFGARLAPAALYEASTVPALARRIDLDAEGGEQGNLVLLAKGSSEPIVLIHPVGGDVLCYRPLVPHLGRDSAVYGIRAGLAPDSSPTLIPDLAAAYLPDVLRVFPQGRCRLVGWSLGGVIAHELARQLTLLGRESVVVLLDPWLAPDDSETRIEARDLIQSFFFNLSNGRLNLAPPEMSDDLDALLRDGLKSAQRLHPALSHLSMDDVISAFRTYARNSLALTDHRMLPAPGVPVTVIEAEEALGLAGPHLRRLRSVSSARRALPTATWHSFPGDHFSFVAEEHAARVGGLIAEGLTKR